MQKLTSVCLHFVGLGEGRVLNLTLLSPRFGEAGKGRVRYLNLPELHFHKECKIQMKDLTVCSRQFCLTSSKLETLQHIVPMCLVGAAGKHW